MYNTKKYKINNCKKLVGEVKDKKEKEYRPSDTTKRCEKFKKYLKFV